MGVWKFVLLAALVHIAVGQLIADTQPSLQQAQGNDVEDGNFLIRLVRSAYAGIGGGNSRGGGGNSGGRGGGRGGGSDGGRGGGGGGNARGGSRGGRW